MGEAIKERAREEVEQVRTDRHKTFAAKFEAEEEYELERYTTFRKVKSWIPQSLLIDIQQLLHGSVPIHMEVVARITVSSFLAYVLALADFSNVVPESQRVLIAMLGSTLGMIFPTLMFSIGLIMFPAMIFVVLLGLVVATMLLSCAAGVGLGFYVVMFGFTALAISGMRFDKRTGAMTCLLIVQVALNSQPLARTAHELGLGFVKSLWTNTGVSNPNAIYTNTLVGMMWVIFAMIVGRLIPPYRTARGGIVKGLLPSSLKSVADSIDLNAQDLRNRQQHAADDTNTNTKGEDVGEGGSKAPKDDGGVAPPNTDDSEKRRINLEKMMIHQKSVLTNGKVAALTAFEPRMLRFGPPECAWKKLASLCSVIDKVVLASIALGDAWRDPDEMDIELEERLVSRQVEAATLLRKCAKAIQQYSRVEVDGTNDTEGKEVAQGNAEETDQDSSAVDPILFDNVGRDVVMATNEWAEVAGPPDHSKPYFDKEARTAIKENTIPWIKGSWWYFIGILQRWQFAFSLSTWKGIFTPPYLLTDKASWCMDFTIGFTALVAIGVFWEKYVALENESWILIAYAFSTTQTAEGTATKGILRLIGTAIGGFSGWLAVTACGEDGIYGLIAWLTVFTALGAYIGLPRGFKARIGLSPDYGYGASYFVMTQVRSTTCAV